MKADFQEQYRKRLFNRKENIIMNKTIGKRPLLFPGTDPIIKTYNPTSPVPGQGWADDTPSREDEKDVIQDSSCLQIFETDTPGRSALQYNSGHRFSYKAKFQQWVEVNIGEKWYVCSPYLNSRSIMHVKFDDATNKWIRDPDPNKANEIVTGWGPLDNSWPNSWSED
jgi:hypothetical protein